MDNVLLLLFIILKLQISSSEVGTLLNICMLVWNWISERINCSKYLCQNQALLLTQTKLVSTAEGIAISSFNTDKGSFHSKGIPI